MSISERLEKVISLELLYLVYPFHGQVDQRSGILTRPAPEESYWPSPARHLPEDHAMGRIRSPPGCPHRVPAPGQHHNVRGVCNDPQTRLSSEWPGKRDECEGLTVRGKTDPESHRGPEPRAGSFLGRLLRRPGLRDGRSGMLPEGGDCGCESTSVCLLWSQRGHSAWHPEGLERCLGIRLWCLS